LGPGPDKEPSPETGEIINSLMRIVGPCQSHGSPLHAVFTVDVTVATCALDWK
jgi:hypothetical protein